MTIVPSFPSMLVNYYLQTMIIVFLLLNMIRFDLFVELVEQLVKEQSKEINCSIERLSFSTKKINYNSKIRYTA